MAVLQTHWNTYEQTGFAFARYFSKIVGLLFNINFIMFVLWEVIPPNKCLLMYRSSWASFDTFAEFIHVLLEVAGKMCRCGS